MIERAIRRNRSAIQAGLVDLRMGGFELLPQLGEMFDKVFSVNVLQFLPERTPVLRTIRSVLKPDGVLATTVQPRHLGATAANAQAFAQTLSGEMIEAGFREVTIKQLDPRAGSRGVRARCRLTRIHIAIFAQVTSGNGHRAHPEK